MIARKYLTPRHEAACKMIVTRERLRVELEHIAQVRMLADKWQASFTFRRSK